MCVCVCVCACIRTLACVAEYVYTVIYMFKTCIYVIAGVLTVLVTTAVRYESMIIFTLCKGPSLS